MLILAGSPEDIAHNPNWNLAANKNDAKIKPSIICTYFVFHFL